MPNTRTTAIQTSASLEHTVGKGLPVRIQRTVWFDQFCKHGYSLIKDFRDLFGLLAILREAILDIHQIELLFKLFPL